MNNNTNLENEVDNNKLLYTYDTLMALVDAIIPRSPALAQIYGEIMLYGALDFYTDEYMYMMLNSYAVPMADLIAELLNVAAWRYLNPEAEDDLLFDEEELYYASLEPMDRLIVLSLLDSQQNIYSNLAITEQYPGWVGITNSLNRYTMLGYYSEWYGYGITRLDSPNDRKLEFYPTSWEQVQYPGPSLSYIDYLKQYDTTRKLRIMPSYIY